jgi:predicted outer membrane repeat protein
MRLLRWVPVLGVGCVSLVTTDTKSLDSGTTPPVKDTGVAAVPVPSGGGSGSSGDTGVPFEPQVCTTSAPESRARPCAVGPDAASLASCAVGGFAALLGGVGYTGVDLALSAAVDGDTVVVCPGTWPGDLVVSAELLLVAADPTPGATVIDGGGVTGGLEISATSTVRGLTVRNGRRSSGGGGIVVTAPSTVLECMTVLDNRSRGGGGVSASGAGLVVRTSTFTGNTAGYDGGGLVARAGVTIEDCVFDQNTSGYEGGAVALDGDAVITRSWFGQNLADYSGAGCPGAGGTTASCRSPTPTCGATAPGTKAAA